MPNFEKSSSLIVRPALQQVVVNGVVQDEAICEVITETSGLRPVAAQLVFPYRFAGDSMDYLRDARVLVYTRASEEEGWGVPVFIGYVRAETAQEDAWRSIVRVVANSVMHLLDRVFVGQTIHRARIDYPRLDPYTKTRNNWTLTRILRSLFQNIALDSNWRAVVQLGDLSGLAAAQFDLQMPDFKFHTESYREALRRLLAYVPDVGVRERFEADGMTYLDFFQWGNPRNGYEIVRVPVSGQGPDEGAIVQAWAKTSDTDDVYSRVIGYGRPVEYQATVGTNDATNPLIPAWENATPYAVTDPDEFSELEKRVLANPFIGQRGMPEFEPEAEFVFRRFKLPVVMRPYTILARNLYEEEVDDYDGNTIRRKIPIQVFTEFYNLEASEVPHELVGEIPATEWKKIDGFNVDAKDQEFTLPKAAIEQSATRKVDGVLQSEFSRVNVFITMTICDERGERPYYDTGTKGSILHPTIRNVGLVSPPFENVNIAYTQIGTATKGSRWFDSVLGTWNEVAAGSPQVVDDDTALLADICERALQERSQRRTRAVVQMPAYTSAKHPGEGIIVMNRGIDDKRLQVVSVSRHLVNPMTVIEASDQVPFHVATDRATFDGKNPWAREAAHSQAHAIAGQYGPSLPRSEGRLNDFAEGHRMPMDTMQQRDAARQRLDSDMARQQSMMAPQGGERLSDVPMTGGGSFPVIPPTMPENLE